MFRWYRVRVYENRLIGSLQHIDNLCTCWPDGKDTDFMVTIIRNYIREKYGSNFSDQINHVTDTTNSRQPYECAEFTNISKVVLGQSFGKQKMKLVMRKRVKPNEVSNELLRPDINTG